MQPEPTRRDALALGALALGGAALGADPGAAALRDLLARNRRFHPEYRGGLSNHLSMELVTLHRLGASLQRLADFADGYSRALDPFPEGGPEVGPETWRAALGREEALAG